MTEVAGAYRDLAGHMLQSRPNTILLRTTSTPRGWRSKLRAKRANVREMWRKELNGDPTAGVCTCASSRSVTDDGVHEEPQDHPETHACEDDSVHLAHRASREN